MEKEPSTVLKLEVYRTNRNKYNSFVAVMLLPALLFHSFGIVGGILCYQCSIRHTQGHNRTIYRQSCSIFNESAKFVINCTKSTFCMKKTFTLTLPKNRSVTISERGCAQQSLIYQVLDNGRWNMAEKIDTDFYRDECTITDDTARIRTNKQEYCFCSSDLCNNQSTLYPQTFIACTLITATVLINIIGC